MHLGGRELHDNFNVYLGSITAFIAAVSGLVAAFVKLWRRDEVQDRRLDLLWEAHVRRGSSEAAQLKLTKPVEDSDMQAELRVDVRAAYDPIAPALREIRKSYPDPGRFAEEVEKRYGDWLVRHICDVLGVSNFACLAMAKLVTDDPEPPKTDA